MSEHGSEHGHSPDARKNHLAGQTSPYLLLHQYNPVDWYPWGEEALAKAREQDKPIFLSVGYSTCYWCHVMERESFSDPAIASLLNEHFVSIKVDREERPDLDEIYMAATQLITQQGGWPNSVFLTPDLEPFFAGTYFPPADRYGRPGFGSLLQNIAGAWKSQRQEIEQSARRIVGAMGQYLEQTGEPAAEPLGAEAAEELAARALANLERRFDEKAGGFGGAPKFPTPSNLYLLFEMVERDGRAGEMLTATLDAMARGGIYDQLGGGFHRYATDAEWLIPHFEKMLYDNGFLLELYALELRRTGDPEMARVVRETAQWLGREMTSPEGGLWSAIDAETEGEEGAFYVWTRDELEAELSGEEAVFLAPVYGFAGAPFFEGDHYVLHLPERLARQADRRQLSREELLERIRPLRQRLFEARARRQRSLTDDKVLADWNGIAIRGLAVAGRLLDEPEILRQAERAADFVLTRMRPQGQTLLHSWRGGEAKIPAYLADYAFLVRGLLALHEAGESDGESRWLEAAAELTDEQVRRLRDPEGGFYVAAEQPDLLLRSKDLFDGALPSPNAVAVLNLLDLARLTGEARWRREAAAALRTFGPLLDRVPEAMQMMAVAARRFGAESVGEGNLSRLTDEAEEAVVAKLELQDGGEDGWRSFRLVLEMAEGWHVNAHPASEDFLVPTTVEGRGAVVRGLLYPEGAALRSEVAEGESQEIRVYSGRQQIQGELRQEVPEAHLLLTYQACDERRCLPPVARELALP